MKITRLLLLVAVAGAYGCSDKEDASSGEENTSLIEKATNMSGELAEKVKSSASEVGEAASASLDKAGEKVGETVDSVKQASSDVVESVKQVSADAAASVVDASKSLADSVTGDDAAQLAGDEVAMSTDAADAEVAAVTEAGQEAVNQVSGDVADAGSSAQKTVETAGLETVSVVDSLDPASVEIGKTIYSRNCMACHAAGVAGAPKMSDTAAWEPRIAQGIETLNAHAIDGFTGSNGVMPPKGGFTTLNDDEVKAAVAYMVSSVSK
jgi:cytochrome c5